MPNSSGYKNLGDCLCSLAMFGSPGKKRLQCNMVYKSVSARHLDLGLLKRCCDISMLHQCTGLGLTSSFEIVNWCLPKLGPVQWSLCFPPWRIISKFLPHWSIVADRFGSNLECYTKQARFGTQGYIIAWKCTLFLVLYSFMCWKTISNPENWEGLQYLCNLASENIA